MRSFILALYERYPSLAKDGLPRYTILALPFLVMVLIPGMLLTGVVLAALVTGFGLPAEEFSLYVVIGCCGLFYTPFAKLVAPPPSPEILDSAAYIKSLEYKSPLRDLGE